MKPKHFFVLSLIGCLFSAIGCALCYFTFQGNLNKMKTEPARAARWKKEEKIENYEDTEKV